MKVCSRFFVRKVMPTFLKETIKKFRLAEDACFLRQEDLDLFLADVRVQLAKDRPVDSSYKVEVIKGMWNEDGDIVAIRRDDKVDGIMAKFTVREYDTVYRFSEKKCKFMNVYHRLLD